MRANLGYWVRDSKIRRGAAREAVRLLREFNLQALGLMGFEIVAASGNEPSRRVAEPSGAIHEGIQRMRSRMGGRSHDVLMFALVADAGQGASLEGTGMTS